jgi:predicted MFS family arabinose efflux permease
MDTAARPGLPARPIRLTGNRARLTVIGAIGLAQVLAWGSSYYLVAVLARPIVADTGWSLAWVVGGLSFGFLVSGLVSPRVGRLIEARGGRMVLAASALLLAAGLVVLGAAPDLPLYLLGWAIMGVGMGAGLYDPAFATLGRLFGESARAAITHVTLIGGFSSTVCWPLSAWLVDHAGWRGTCFAYAAIDVAVVLPLYLLGVPRETRQAAPIRTADHRPAAGAAPPGGRAAFLLLAATLTLASLIMTVISVHLLTLLQARGVALPVAVGLGALLGPSQVGARLLDMTLARRRHPVWTLVASTVLVAAGLGLLAARPGAASVGIVLYGAGSGIRSIARGTVPLALFGRVGYAAVMGRLAMPAFIGQAIAPALGGVLIDRLGASITMLMLFALAVATIVPAVMLVAAARGGKARAG